MKRDKMFNSLRKKGIPTETHLTNKQLDDLMKRASRDPGLVGPVYRPFPPIRTIK